MQTTEVGTRMLDSIGSTADEIAATLRASGIRGIRHSTRYFNPVVQYVYRQLGNHALHINVKHGTTLIVVGGTGIREVVLSPAIRSFLAAFNAGQYPDLESDDSPTIA